MKKTNAVRWAEKCGMAVEVAEYEVDESDLSAERAAEKMHVSPDEIFKTLVLRSDKGEILVACIPGYMEIDLKALARAGGYKKVEMVHMKEIRNLTGYIRGGVSPLGMKKDYPLFIDERAQAQPLIYVSAGRRGLQMHIRSEDLVRASKGKVCAIASEKQ